MIVAASSLETLLLHWRQQGFLLWPGSVDGVEEGSGLHPDRMGSLLRGGSRSVLAHPVCQQWLQRLLTDVSLRQLIPATHRAIQCTYFEKSAGRNWLVSWHQDLSVPVQERIDHPALCGWSRKEGSWFVQPPVALLEQCIIVRVHLDHCGEHDGALRVIPGSHLSGRLSAGDIRQWQAQHAAIDCYRETGQILLMRPLLLHASSKASGQSRRRVLNFVFAPDASEWSIRWE